MTAKKITAMDALGAAPADGDQFVIVDVSDTTEAATGTTKKLAASHLARVGAVNTFSVAQIINAENALTLRREGVDRIRFIYTATAAYLILESLDNGSSIGNRFQANRNSNVSTPAAGHILLEAGSGSDYRIWPDATGQLRMHTSDPTYANDTSGTVIGTQTSWHALKENVAEWDGAEALDAIRALKLFSYQMIEDGQKTPDGDKPTYHGIVITDEDRAANAWFGLGYAENQIPALNDRNLFGYMLAAIRHGGDIIESLQTQVAALEARVAALEGA